METSPWSCGTVSTAVCWFSGARENRATLHIILANTCSIPGPHCLSGSWGLRTRWTSSRSCLNLSLSVTFESVLSMSFNESCAGSWDCYADYLGCLSNCFSISDSSAGNSPAGGPFASSSWSGSTSAYFIAVSLANITWCVSVFLMSFHFLLNALMYTQSPGPTLGRSLLSSVVFASLAPFTCWNKVRCILVRCVI